MVDRPFLCILRWHMAPRLVPWLALWTLTAHPLGAASHLNPQGDHKNIHVIDSSHCRRTHTVMPRSEDEVHGHFDTINEKYTEERNGKTLFKLRTFKACKFGCGYRPSSCLVPGFASASVLLFHTAIYLTKEIAIRRYSFNLPFSSTRPSMPPPLVFLLANPGRSESGYKPECCSWRDEAV